MVNPNPNLNLNENMLRPNLFLNVFSVKQIQEVENIRTQAVSVRSAKETGVIGRESEWSCSWVGKNAELYSCVSRSELSRKGCRV